MRDCLKKERRIRIFCILLLAGTFCAAIKSIFVSLQVDEEYAISMAYRMLQGDRMLTQIWDPHQTSAFLIEFFMWMYIKIFQTTSGVVIWLRLCGTMIHGMIAFYMFRILKHYLIVEYSFCLAILYFNLSPKGYVTPEFSNMLVWSFTLLLLGLFYLDKQKNCMAAVVCGFWMCIMVLSYPSAILLFPFALWYLWKREDYGRKSAVIFAGVCLAGGCSYLAYLFNYMTLGELFDNIHYMLIGNSGHTEAGVVGRITAYLKESGLAVLISAFYGAVSLFLMITFLKSKKCSKQQMQDKQERRVLAVYLLLFTALGCQVVHWILMQWEYEYSYIYNFYFILMGIAYYMAGKLEEELRRIIRLWLGGSALMFLSVLALTDLTIFTSVRYVLPGVIMGIVALLSYSEIRAPVVYKKCAGALLLLWCFTAIFVKCWEYPAYESRMQNITCVRGIVSEGPAKGLLTEYMQSYIQESNYVEMHQYVNPGDKILILDMGTISYLFQKAEVASYTTICDPRYNDVLLKYWELNPQKYPNVIAVQCWYGDLRWNPESWIMQWIENSFGATQVIDGKYFRYYIR